MFAPPPATAVPAGIRAASGAGRDRRRRSPGFAIATPIPKEDQMNTIQLTGRLVRDPELRSTSTGDRVCAMRLAVDGMGRANGAGYIDVSVFGKPGEACARHLSRGWLVAVTGRLQYREWVTDDGSKRHAHQVIGAVEFLAAPRASEPATSAVGAAA